jgi:glutamate-1-semialdehyde 2,1-aminomutase
MADDLDYLPGRCFGTFKLPDEIAFVATNGKGARISTADGRTLVDYVLGSGPMIIGHCHPRVVAAINEQAARGTTFYAMNDMAPRLAARIHDMVPCAEAVKFVSDGTEATAYAIRFARAFTGRTLVVKFEGAYHGHHDYALHGLKPLANRNYPDAVPDSAGIPPGASSTILMAPYNDLEALRSVVSPVKDQIAAIIIEPVQRSIMPAAGYLAGVRALCDEIGAILIFDEVVTGFRLALGGAQELFGVKPDLCSLGKAIGGGLPLAALAGRRDILELGVPGRPDDGRSVYISGTLNGNPLAAAAGLATLDVLADEGGPARLAEVGDRIVEGFKQAAAQLSIPFQMIGPSSIPEPVFSSAKIVDGRTYAAVDRASARQFGIEMIKRGIFVNPIAKLYMSTVHDDEAINQTCQAAYDAMKTVRDSGLLDKAA